VKRIIGALPLIFASLLVTIPQVEARQFKKPAYYPAGTLNWGVITADFNHDGNLDLITADFDNSKLYVFLGKGDGTFHKPLISDIPSPSALAIGDFNGDHIPDFAAVEGRGPLAIYLGNGDGTFRNSANYSLGDGLAGDIAVADFNGDGHPDIAATNEIAGTVMVFFGKGNGKFRKPVTYTVPNYPYGIAAADLNGDHHPDLVVIESGEGGAAAIMMNDGQGKFKLTETYDTPSNDPLSVAVAALKNGGNLDLIVSCNAGIAVFPGNGDGTFGTPTLYQVAGGATDSVVADFNGDGNLDVVTAFNESTRVALFYGKGDGTLKKPISIGMRYTGVTTLLTADFNKDGAPDLAIGTSPDLAVLLNAR
jgi:FG-GAP-like repeat